VSAPGYRRHQYGEPAEQQCGHPGNHQLEDDPEQDGRIGERAADRGSPLRQLDQEESGNLEGGQAGPSGHHGTPPDRSGGRQQEHGRDHGQEAEAHQVEPEPKPAHRALRFLATDFAGGTYLEHTWLEMALGEGFVLMAIYALIHSLPESEARNLLIGLSRQEEGHVTFGEDQTLRWLRRDPSQARHLLGLALVSVLGIGQLAGWVRKR
jgi:hypothetical protein